VAIVACILCYRSCDSYKNQLHNERTANTIDSLSFEVEIDDKNRKIAKQEVNRISDKKMIGELTQEVAGLKVTAQVRATVRTGIQNVTTEPIGGDVLVIHDTIVDSSGIPQLKNYLGLPQAYGIENEWYKFYYHIDTTGSSRIDIAEFVTKPVISFGTKKEPFPANIFNSPTYEVAYQDKNPYSTVTSMVNVEYHPEPKIWQRKGVIFGVGAITGMYIASKM